MVHDAIDGGHRGHRVLEDPVPFREHEVGCDDHALAFVTFGQQRKEHFHFVPVVLDVTDVVEDQTFEAIELGKFLRQPQIALGRQQPLHQCGSGCKQDW